MLLFEQSSCGWLVLLLLAMLGLGTKRQTDSEGDSGTRTFIGVSDPCKDESVGIAKAQAPNY